MEKFKLVSKRKNPLRPMRDVGRKMVEGEVRTLPKQSLGIKEILDRFVKGIPVDVVRREAVYVDHDNIDLEKVSRMDFGEKVEFAQQMGEKARQQGEALKKASEERRESQAKDEPKQAGKKPKQGGPKKTTDIDDLDNTMSVDTDPDSQ